MEKDAPTLLPCNPFDAASDVTTLYNAMKGMGTNEVTIINILCNRSQSQRMKISQLFKSTYGKDLPEELKKEFSGDLQSVLVALTLPPGEYLANELHQAVDGAGTDESVLTGILCSRGNQEIKDITTSYERLYGRSLERDLKGDISGMLKNLTIAIIQGNRDERTNVDEKKAKEDAEHLVKAGEGRMGTDEAEFVAVLATRSFSHIRQISKEYEKLKGHSLEKAIRKEFSGESQKALLTIVERAENKAAYFAKQLHEALGGLGTKDKNLIRIIVSRADVDLANIKAEYEKLCGKSLEQDVAEDTSGDYKKALLTIIN